MRFALTILISIVVLLVILALVGRTYFTNSPRPAEVGVNKIADCPNSPNCVSTRAKTENQQIDSISIRNSGAETLDELERIIGTMPKSRVITRTDEYLYVEFRSPFWNL